jgi:chromosomal replication initiator protein
MSFSAFDLWGFILGDLQNHINRQTFDMWFKDTEAVLFDGATLTVKVQDEVAKRHIIENYSEVFLSIILSKTGKQISLNFIVNSNDVVSVQKPIITQSNALSFKKDEIKDSKYSYLNPKYTFDTFIVGPNNQLAFATAISISKQPGKNYNPFFIYGESGLGKTHLLQAIGNAITSEKPFLAVLYTTIEQFMNEFIQSIQNNTQQSFKIKYRNVDVLLIDDIQFIQNKEGTQEEFFHTFEDLHKNSKQIVISSDRPPKEISHLAERLRTRFEWGLQADIKPPNIETREAILRKKAEVDELDISDEVLTFIAKRIKANIRKLESALTTLKAISSIQNEQITINLAKQHLKQLFDEEVSKQITITDIMQKVSERTNVTVDELQSKSRHSSIVQPRFIAMYISTRLTNLTTIDIGKEFGNRDHSTVINARNSIQKQMENDETFRENIEDIISEIKS